MRSTLISPALALGLAACAGRLEYQPPTPATAANAIVVAQPRDAVWNRMVASLGNSWFVINTIDRTSGLINLTYRGRPDAHLDCGRVVSRVTNLAGTRTHDFAAATAHQEFEVLNGAGLHRVIWTLRVEGRINLVLAPQGTRRTRATAAAQYEVTRTLAVSTVGGATEPARSHTIRFLTGDQGTFPAEGGVEGVTCRPSGALEQELLALLSPEPQQP